MTTVAVTGVSGLVGRRLATQLDRDEDVDRILGLDVEAPRGLSCPKLQFRETDVRAPGLAELLEDVDALVHLAFILDPIQDEEHMRDVNVFGTRNVFEAAATAGVDRVVYLSSGVAYGAHPDNDLPLTEDSPLRANPDFNYAEHKLEVEQWLWPWLEEHPGMRVAVLRPSIVAGPGVDNFITRQMEAPRFPAIVGHKPPWQFVHVDDVATAAAHAVEQGLEGAYNVSSEGWLSFDEVVEILGRRPVFIPEEVAFGAYEALWNLGLAEAPPGEINYIMHPWVLDVERLMETGWRPRHSNRHALAALVEEHRDRITLLGRTVHRSALRRAAGAGVAVLVLVLLRAVLRRLVGSGGGASDR